MPESIPKILLNNTEGSQINQQEIVAIMQRALQPVMQQIADKISMLEELLALVQETMRIDKNISHKNMSILLGNARQNLIFETFRRADSKVNVTLNPTIVSLED